MGGGAITATEPDPTNIRSPIEIAAPTSRLRRTRAQKGETILAERQFKPCLF